MSNRVVFFFILFREECGDLIPGTNSKMPKQHDKHHLHKKERTNKETNVPSQTVELQFDEKKQVETS
jgi:hypothetical protein